MQLAGKKYFRQVIIVDAKVTTKISISRLFFFFLRRHKSRHII
jgi:hypothetical protein